MTVLAWRAFWGRLALLRSVTPVITAVTGVAVRRLAPALAAVLAAAAVAVGAAPAALADDPPPVGTNGYGCCK
ncbi:hypothetical protein GCM10025868_15420 [Angustibacter aerolatus]|uniref:Uncharacterized protein n=1 Tax=Angustibacter aerolatus TaxID=1162965 RepID=A0ABQ6JDN0_9ACTN|nr:hypothetical protein GCM10025868_15420 [Angustibacter aerolatus]